MQHWTSPRSELEPEQVTQARLLSGVYSPGLHSCRLIKVIKLQPRTVLSHPDGDLLLLRWAFDLSPTYCSGGEEHRPPHSRRSIHSAGSWLDGSRDSWDEMAHSRFARLPNPRFLVFFLSTNSPGSTLHHSRASPNIQIHPKGQGVTVFSCCTKQCTVPICSRRQPRCR